MTHSGNEKVRFPYYRRRVLIPLLLDDPLWVTLLTFLKLFKHVLIPLLLDDPLWEFRKIINLKRLQVLIPLLLDDPLWVETLDYLSLLINMS